MSLDVTYRCTMRCLHCFNGSSENTLEPELTDLELLDLSEQIAEIQPNVICFCGGEPLLRKEIVCRCCNNIVRKTGGQTVVNMVTNGELLSKEVAKDLREAGFSFVQVSLDGAKPETHDWLRNKRGSYYNAILAIQNLKEVGIKVGVACTPTLKNLGEIEELIEICEELGVEDFRMQPLMLIGRAKRNLKGNVPSYHDYRKIAVRLQMLQLKKAAKSGMRIEWGDPVDHLIRSKYRENGYDPFVGIDAYGYLRISPYLPITFGNIRKHSIMNYWKHGLSKIWNASVVRWLADRVKSIEDLDLQGQGYKVPEVYWEKSVNIDVVEENVWNLKPEDLFGLSETREIAEVPENDGK